MIGPAGSNMDPIPVSHPCARQSTDASRKCSAPTRRVTDIGSGGYGMPQSKHQHVLKPLTGSHLGSVYSMKMTLGCKPSSSTRKMRMAKKKRAGEAVRKYGGQPAVRLMLPWWHNSSSNTSAGSKEVDATSEERGTGQHADNMSKIAAGVEAQTPTEQSSRPATPQSTPSHPGEERHEREREDSGSNASNLRPVGSHISAIDETAYEEAQQGIEEYTHYSNLFENPPPTIPNVDQYILDNSVLYEAISKRGHRKALPVNPSGGDILGIQECGDAQWAAAGFGSTGVDDLEAYVNPEDLLYADEDIDKLLSFFDHMKRVDNRVTLEEMILGFRKVRREWATVQAEKSGRAVLEKVLRLMERAGMSLEAWFRFMDMSQNGRGDGKLTALELRTGLSRLITYIARRECCCRAYKCDRIPNYGLPVHTDAQAHSSGKDGNGAVGTKAPSSCHHQQGDVRQQSLDSPSCEQDATLAPLELTPDPTVMGSLDGAENPCSEYSAKGRAKGQPCGANVEDITSGEAGLQREEQRRRGNWRVRDDIDESTFNVRGGGTPKPSAQRGQASQGSTSRGDSNGAVARPEGSDEGASKDEDKEASFKEKGRDAAEDEARSGETRNSAGHLLSGRAIACREHALEGMVYLGQRAYFQGLEKQTFAPKEIVDFMRFVDKDVNFTLDLNEMRLAISRMRSGPDQDATTRLCEAGHLLEVLEQYMHRTGARFIDVFSLLDRNRSGYIKKDELRALFETLSREPARRRARAKMKEGLVAERLRQKELRVIEAQDAAVKLEMFKKAGVYSVLKRIEVWQSRTGKRLSEGFHGGTGVGAGNRGLDVDELAAFMRNLDLDLSPNEAMLVLRHLDGGQNGLVEVSEVASAVRTIRRYESIIRAEKKNQARSGTGTGGGGGLIPRSLPLSVADGTGQLAGGSPGGEGSVLDDAAERGWGGGDDGIWGGTGHLWECPSVCGLGGRTSPLEKLVLAGPSVFRPPVGVITHGRASSAPARGRRTPQGAGASSRRPTTAAGTAGPVAPAAAGPTFRRGVRTNTALHGGTFGDAGAPPPTTTSRGFGAHAGGSRHSVSGATGTSPARQHQQQQGRAGRSPRLIPSPIISEGSGGGRFSGGGAARGDDVTTDPASSSVAGTAAAASEEEGPLPPWELGLRVRFDGSGGWWPAAKSAVEDGARLDIYTGSVLDGRWLSGLDTRLRATMRATRR